jgi:hypothetical protein
MPPERLRGRGGRGVRGAPLVRHQLLAASFPSPGQETSAVPASLAGNRLSVALVTLSFFRAAPSFLLIAASLPLVPILLLAVALLSLAASALSAFLAALIV